MAKDKKIDKLTLEEEKELFRQQSIQNIDMEHEVKKSFIEYAMSVIIARALPDVRDGMKPGQRRILYAMWEDNIIHSKPFYKSATTVGNVLGRYHPHGDAAVYGSMVRMAQDFSYRYPLVEGHGNFGSVDGDEAAAYRYTEARLDKIADEMMRDLNKNVVDMMPNFDNRRVEPTVLPSRFPNLLVNGAMGIAVGMATNIPPHNLAEVIDGTIYRMEHKDCTVDELMQFIKGPDFPTGATVYGLKGIKDAYETGKGHIKVRSKSHIEEEHHRIVFTEIPYAVNKSMLVESIANCVKDKKIEGVVDLRDESGREGMRIVVEYKRDANPIIIQNLLYKLTQLEDTFAVNMLAIVDNAPRLLNLPTLLDLYIAHQESVVTRRLQFDKEKAEARVHILEGYKTAIDNIDAVVALMKSSASIPESKTKLMETYGLDDVQAQAIVEMTLGRLTGLEIEKVLDEIKKLGELIADLADKLADIEKIRAVIKQEMIEIRDKYRDERRTDLVEAEDEIDLADLIEKHNCVVTMTHGGYIKRIPADTYSEQNRGGKGIIGMATKDEDYVEQMAVVFSHSHLLFFTDRGKVQHMEAFRLPEATRTAKGQNIVNLLQLEKDEKVTAMVSTEDFAEGKYLVMVTKNGIIKRCNLSDFEYQRKGGKKAINLDENDSLVYVGLTDGNAELMIATNDGRVVRFAETESRVMGRTARGVRAIRLKADAFVVGVASVEDGKSLIVVTENGFGKRSEYDEFRTMAHRGGQGVRCFNISEKSGQVVGVASVGEDQDLLMITNNGTIIRTAVDGIPTHSRSAGGVIVMRMSDEQKLVNFTVCEHKTEEDEAEVAEGTDLSVADVTAEGNGNEA